MTKSTQPHDVQQKFFAVAFVVVCLWAALFVAGFTRRWANYSTGLNGVIDGPACASLGPANFGSSAEVISLPRSSMNLGRSFLSQDPFSILSVPRTFFIQAVVGHTGIIHQTAMSQVSNHLVATAANSGHRQEETP